MLLADEILGDISSFPYEEETVQLTPLADAKNIYSPLYHGKYHNGSFSSLQQWCYFGSLVLNSFLVKIIAAIIEFFSRERLGRMEGKNFVPGGWVIVNKKERGGCGSFLAPSCSVH